MLRSVSLGIEVEGRAKLLYACRSGNGKGFDVLSFDSVQFCSVSLNSRERIDSDIRLPVAGVVGASDG